MKVLAQRYGLLKKCEQCHALLSYTAADIYEKKYIYCPICRHKQQIDIQEGERKNGTNN